MKIGLLDNSRRRRLFYCLVALALAVGASRQAQAANTTTVQDVVYQANQKSIPLTPATAGIYGLLSDVLLDWACAKIPFLKGRIPNGSNAAQPTVS